MSSDKWSDIEFVATFLQSSSWEEEIGNLSKAQLLLIAEYLNMDVVEATKKRCAAFENRRYCESVKSEVG